MTKNHEDGTVGEKERSAIPKWVWVLPVIITLLGLAFQAGFAFATFATKTDVKTEVETINNKISVGHEAARAERMASIEKAMGEHKQNQKDEMDRLWKTLDRIEAKVDRLKR